MIKRRRVPKEEIEKEWIILSFMIMNNRVLSNVYKRYKTKEFKTKYFSEYFRPIARWLFRHFSIYKKAPKDAIQNIYEQRKNSLGGKQKIIEEYLSRLAEEYVLFKERSIDPEYIIKDVIADFIRERQVNDLMEKANEQIKLSQFDEVENILSSYRKVTIEEEDEELGTLIPLTTKDVDEYYDHNPTEDIVYKFNGDLNYLAGNLEKSWLVAVSGTEKSGKSYFLQEIAFDAAMYQRKKVLIINLELSKKLVRNRLQRRISCTSNKRGTGRKLYPIFDCQNNQTGKCKVEECKNPYPLYNKDNESVEFQNRRDWEICTKCRYEQTRRNVAITKRFLPAIWYNSIRLKEVSKIRVRKALKENEMQGLKNLRVKCFPRYSVSFDDTTDYIYNYIEKKKWKPDIIVYDYLDILAREQGLEGRFDIDEKWKKASRLSSELDVLVLTADQANKIARENRSLTQMSTTENKGKDSHLDVRIAINKTPKELDLGLMRISVLFHRHEEFTPEREVMVTQRLATADPILDSTMWYRKRDYYPVNASIF